jgi:hypothetical protein
VQTSSASAETLALSISNAGAGSADLTLSADDRVSLVSSLAQTSSGFRFEQTGAGGERADLFVGSSSPDGVTTSLSGSVFLLDDGVEGAAYLNTSSGGTGSEWSRVVEERRHAALRQLIHFLDDGPGSGFASGAFRETISSGVFPTEIIWWEDGTKTGRIVDLAIVYSGAFPSSETWRMYDTDGSTVLITLVDAISYSGAVESSRTRTWS